MDIDSAIQTSAQREARRAASARAAIPRDRVLRSAALAGIVWLALYAIATAFSAGSEHAAMILGDLVFLIPVAAASVLTVVAARRATGRHRAMWHVMAVSNALWLAGEVTWSFYEIVLGRESPFPSLADVFYLSSVALVLPAIVLGFRPDRRTRTWRGLLDASVIMMALGVTGIRWLIAPQLADGFSVATLTGIAYPLLDVAVIILLCSLVFGGNRFVPRSVTLVGFAFAAAAITDAIYTYVATVHEYSTGGWLDIGWELEAVLMCLAALTVLRHGEGDAIVQRIPRDLGLPLMLGGAALASTIMVIDAFDGRVSFSSTVMASAALLAMVVRLVLTSREKGSIAVDLQRALDEQERLAVTDPLTGLHNRRFFEEVLRMEWDRAVRADAPLGILVIDVDHFKSINDEHGHVSGDAVLVQLAARLRTACRPSDVLARYGGEEFVVILINAGSEVLLEVGERFRRVVGDLPFQLIDGARRVVTASVGGACRPDHAKTHAELLRMADRALYTAKDLGRDRVLIGDTAQASEPGPLLRDADEGLLLLEQLADEIDAVISESAHSRVMAAWAATVAEALGHDSGVTRRAMIAARLHDVGKLVVPNSILAKPGPLSEQDWVEVKRHPSEGRRLVSLAPERRAIAAIIEQHHERWDGAGYPNGYAGEQILVEARIVAVCDAWAAMRADRPYRAALNVEDAREQLREGAGSQFDPECVRVFLELEADGAVGDIPSVTRDDARPS